MAGRRRSRRRNSEPWPWNARRLSVEKLRGIVRPLNHKAGDLADAILAAMRKVEGTYHGGLANELAACVQAAEQLRLCLASASAIAKRGG